MGELIDLSEYKKKKEEEDIKELEYLKKQVDALMSQHPPEYLPYYKLDDSYNVGDFYGARIHPPSLDGYSEWWGAEDEFSYCLDYGEED